MARPWIRNPSGPPEEFAAYKGALEKSIRAPPCTCGECQTGFYSVKDQRYEPAFSYRFRLSDVGAKHLIQSSTQQIKENREYLAERLKSHADLLMSRWRKRSQDKRHALLTEAAPDLEISPWINIYYNFSFEKRLINSRSLRRRRQLLVPWLSVEVLKNNPAVLFALLHYRVAYPPQDWAAFDCRQLTAGWDAAYFDVDFSSKCVVMYGLEYGNLVDWEEGPAHRADIIGFPRAQLVLEAQAFIMTTLRSIVDKILDGVDESLPARNEKWLELTANAGFKRTGEVEFWSPYTNQAFSTPPRLDANYLLSLAKTRLDATGDHLWHLQWDPAYMRRHLKLQLQNKHYKLVDEIGAAWHFASHTLDEVGDHFWWRWTEIECKNVADLQRRFGDNIQPGYPLPAKYEQALGALELILVIQVLNLSRRLKQSIPYSPGFCHLWDIQRVKGSYSNFKLKKKHPENEKESFEADPLHWCLIQLQGEPDIEPEHPAEHDYAMLFAFLQDYLAQNSFKERARLDEVLYKKLSNLSTAHEMLVAIHLSRPQTKARTFSEVRVSEVDKNRDVWKLFSNSKELTPGSATDVERCGKGLVQDFYHKPPSDQKNAEWMRRSKASRAALEEFWSSIRGIVKKYFASSPFTKNDIDSHLEIISAHKTPEYLDAVRSEENKILAEIDSNTIEPMLRQLALHDSGSKIKAEVKSTREKIKTRPEPGSVQSNPVADASDPVPDGEPNVERPLIPVTERSMHIFRHMFPNTAEESSKMVNWDEFVHAICDVGFTARSNGGSAVLFENIEGGKIVLHKPHPVAKIDSIMLQSMGKRMTKWFGWNRDRFVLVDRAK